jgi:4-carboxymuconolactone decarboxylase
MDDQERHAKGMAVRRAVLGSAHVDRAQANRNELTTEFQDFITRYAWGEIWTRPGLPRHTRSLLTIAMMVATNREEELKLHLRAAANNDAGRDLLRCAGSEFRLSHGDGGFQADGRGCGQQVTSKKTAKGIVVPAPRRDDQ